MIRLFLNVCKTFQKIKHMDFSDYDIYLYLSAGSTSDALLCPCCKAPNEMLTSNGYYKRHLVFIDNGHVQDKFVEIKDFKCTSCNRSHALLYSFMIPHSPYSIHFIIDLIYRRLTRQFKNVVQLCEFYDITERTFYRIWKRVLMDAHHMHVLLHTYDELLTAIDTLFHSDYIFFHSFLEGFFKACGYSFMQPHITFRQHILARGSSTGGIR